MFRFILLFCVLIYSVVALPFDVERVVGGTDAKDGEYPYIVSLRRAGSNSHMCGASIISPEWILTAAHCVHGTSAKSLSVQYGITKISSDERNSSEVQTVISHKNYDPQRIVNDIAVLKLKVPFKFGKLVQPVKLPKQDQETPGDSSAVLVGWGRNATGGSVQKHLQKVKLITFSYNDCSQRHGGRVYPTNICAGVPEGGKGQCNGDSGGPLTVNGIEVGIVSWSIKPCTIAPYPGVFTKVSSYINWIESNTGLKF